MENLAFVLKTLALIVSVTGLIFAFVSSGKAKGMVSRVERAGRGELSREELALLADFFAGRIRSLADGAKKPPLFIPACVDVYEDTGLTKFLDELPGDELQRAEAGFFAAAGRAGINDDSRNDPTLKERYDFIALGTAALVRAAGPLGAAAASPAAVTHLASEKEWLEYAACYQDAGKVAGVREEAVQAALDRRFAAIPLRVRLAVLQGGWERLEPMPSRPQRIDGYEAHS